MARIELSGVSVDLPIYEVRSRALKAEIVRRTVGGQLSNASNPHVVTVCALDQVSLALSDGDRVGLIGPNGAGKTTLLRLMAGIYPPTAGTVRIAGSVSTLIDLNVGMDTEATGYENIVMRGILFGLTRKQAHAIIPDIEEFTELSDYLALPIRTYSAGMLLRLAFAVSTAVQPDILIIDEIIGVGDASFVKKAELRVGRLMEAAKILVLASHSPDILRRFCRNSIWLQSGSIRQFGPTEEVLAAYGAPAVPA